MDMRELDARVAREVMGFKEPKTPGKRLCPKPYSTDMNAAMEMVEKLRTLLFNFELTAGCDTFKCWFEKNLKKGFAEADTPALAICLAALEAVAGKDKE